MHDPTRAAGPEPRPVLLLPKERAGGTRPGAGPPVTDRHLALVLSVAAIAAATLPMASAGSPRATVLVSQDLPQYRQAVDGVTADMGAPLEVVFLGPEKDADDAAVRSLTADRPDVVIAIGSRAARLARQRLPDTRLVYSMVFAQDRSSLEAAHVTGVLLDVPPETQLAAFRAALPRVRTLGLLFDPARSAEAARAAQRAAEETGFSLTVVPVAAPAEVPAAFRSLAKRVEALWLIPDATVVSKESLEFLLRECLDRRLPVMAFSGSMARAGALLAVGVDYRGLGSQTARVARRVLDGGTVGPPEPAQGTSLSLNLRTAEELGIVVPPAVVAKATEVFR